MDFVLRRIVKAAMRRGMAGNGVAWVVLAGAAFVLRRALNDTGGPVSKLKIAPGEQVLITVRDAGAPVLVSAGVAADGSVGD
jgi:hypothetical protein